MVVDRRRQVSKVASLGEHRHLLPYHHGASITVRRHVTKAATPEQCASLPLQTATGALRYDMAEIYRRACPSTAARIQQLIHSINRPFGDDVAAVAQVDVPRSRASRADIQKRVAAGGVRFVGADRERQFPSRGTVNVFSVPELHKEPPRRRAIDHPVEQNDAVYESEYSNQAEILPAYRHLNVVFEECSVVCDITASYYGSALDDLGASFYRFRDESGRLCELTLHMMGHVLTSEVQHLITCVIIGHPDHVRAEFDVCKLAGLQAVPIAYIDNALFAGNWANVRKARSVLQAACKACNVAMNIGDVGTVNEFLGMEVSHGDKTVRLGKKTRSKLPQSIPHIMRAGDLEGLIGRLIFSAQIQQEPLVKHWWALKWCRRVFNQLNYGKIDVDAMIKIDQQSVRRSLSYWLRTCDQPHRVRAVKSAGAQFVLFTDATLEGWGAVLVDVDTNQIFVTGARFTGVLSDININISAKEAAAIELALRAFSDKVATAQYIHFVVDNTSAQHGVLRGQVRAASLVPHVAAIWDMLFKHNVQATVQYVKSADNPADELSRELPLLIDKLRHATGHASANLRLGAMGASSFFTPLASVSR